MDLFNKKFKNKDFQAQIEEALDKVVKSAAEAKNRIANMDKRSKLQIAGILAGTAALVGIAIGVKKLLGFLGSKKRRE